jgi:putative ubiquitin-RnfH superfamily antitoxin RatB of RatAB toxin-antitoxin module
MQTEDTEQNSEIEVEVAFARPDKQRVIALNVAEGSSAYDAVIASGIVSEFPEIDPDSDPMGIFSKPLNGKGRPLPAEYRLRPGDRVEIYRPLTIDPKQARLERAKDRVSNKQAGKS